MDNLSLLDTASLQYSIQCISGSLTLTNTTYITNQPYFMNAYLSTVRIHNSTIYDITSDGSVLIAVETNIELDDVEIKNLHTTGLGKFARISFESRAIISNMIYENSTMKFTEALSSEIQINALGITYITLTQYIIDFVDCENIELKNLVMHDINTTKYDMIHATSTSINLIKNMTVYDIDSTMLYIIKSNITLIDDIEIYNVAKGIHIDQSSIGLLQNSHIYQSGSTSIQFGGALHMINSNSTMMNMTFNHNTAQIGGAIHISCDNYDICQNTISDSNISYNYAVEQGGAINYDFRRPEISNNIIFIENVAQYGPNIASYPVRIVNSVNMNDPIVLTNVASGLVYQETIRMLLIDFDNQTMNLVNNDQIKIVQVTSGAQLKGVDYSVLINGEAEFDNLQFVYGPGRTNVSYLATCGLIYSDKVSYLSLPTDNSIDVSFRYCKPGEIVINNETCSE